MNGACSKHGFGESNANWKPPEKRPSLDRLAAFTKRILNVPKEKLREKEKEGG